MTEPVTTYKTLIVPNTGDLSGAWGTSALNPNFQLIDAMFGGVTTISLGAATSIVLTVPPATGIWVGPTTPQSNNAMIRFTGTQSGSCDVSFKLPGYYLIDNQVAPTNTFYISLNPGAGGTTFVAPPQGTVSHIFYDGSSGIKFVNLGIPGSALDLQGWTTIPRWITDTVPQPYLLKDGTSYSTATYPHLAWALRGAFGNTDPPGASFFVPDEMARARIAIDKNATGRLTSAVSGINGALMGSAGGDQRLQSHTHSNTLTDPGHVHTARTDAASNPFDPGVGGFVGTAGNTGPATTGVTITNANVGTGSAQNVQPSIVSFLPLVKT